MIKKINKVALASALTLSFIASDVYSATEWNVSLWSKRRAFTEHVEKLAELVSAKTNGEFQLNISFRCFRNQKLKCIIVLFNIQNILLKIYVFILY